MRTAVCGNIELSAGFIAQTLRLDYAVLGGGSAITTQSAIHIRFVNKQVPGNLQALRLADICQPGD